MYSKKQRIAAMTGIILLVLLYLVTLVCAICNFDGSGRLFQACLFATIAVPLLIWIYIYLYGKLTNRHTMASFMPEDTAGSGDDAEQTASGASESADPDSPIR